MAATDLKHPFTAQVDLGRGAMVELNMEPVGLVGFRERQRHRRLFLVASIEEYHVIGCGQAGLDAVKALRDQPVECRKYVNSTGGSPIHVATVISPGHMLLKVPGCHRSPPELRADKVPGSGIDIGLSAPVTAVTPRGQPSALSRV